MAVALSAKAVSGTAPALSVADEDATAASCTLWLDGGNASIRTAAFNNSVAAAALDFDSLHVETATHPDIVIVPSVLAVGESFKLSGREALAAIALGDDLLCRMAQCTQKHAGWFYTSLYGGIATAAITAYLLGCKSDGIANAMGLAYLTAGGTQQPAFEKSMAKRFQAAFAVLCGLTSAQLAKNGIAGPENIFEGRFGLFEMYEMGDADRLTVGLGRDFENERISYKAFPSCQCNHALIETIVNLRHRHGLKAGDVSGVAVTLSPYMERLVGRPFNPGQSSQVDAQFSAQFSAACAMLYGRLGVEEIMKADACEPALAQLIQKVTIKVDPSNTGKYAPVSVAIKLNDGQMFAETATSYSGSPERPLQDRDVIGKFRSAVTLGNYDAVAAEKLLSSLMSVEDCDSIGEVTAPLRALTNDPKSG
jgi:2-methylcitrate dehydratase PrpD